MDVLVTVAPIQPDVFYVDGTPLFDEYELNVLIMAYFVDQGMKGGVKVRIERFCGRNGSRWVVTAFLDRPRRVEFTAAELTNGKTLKMLVAEKFAE